MDTLILERDDRIIITTQARLVREGDEAAADLAQAGAWRVEQANPLLKWIAGNYVQGGVPNSNRQYFDPADLRAAEHTIKFTPLNMIHRTRQPMGFFHSTRLVEHADAAASSPGPVTVEALAAMWAHTFPWEAHLVDEADKSGRLYLSMEARGTHLACAGEGGCGQQFVYAAVDTHCEHLRDRASVRHIVQPTFQGGGLIIPPVEPGWREAKARVLPEAVMAEAAKLAEHASEAAPPTVTDAQWESLWRSILALAEAPA